MARREVAAQTARSEQAAQEPAPGEPAVDLLEPLLEQLALGLPHLERGGVGQVPEVVQVVVQPLQFGQQHPEEPRAPRNLGAGGGLDGLAVAERMGDAAHPGDALREHHRRVRVAALEKLLQAAVLEEQPRPVVQDLLADVAEQELGRLHHVGPHRTEGQHLHVGALHLQQRGGCGRVGHRHSRRAAGVQRRTDRRGALVQHQGAGLRMVLEADPAEVGDLALVPAEQRRGVRQAGHEPVLRPRAPQLERLARPARRQVAQLGRLGFGEPAPGHLHPAAIGEQIAACRLQLVGGEAPFGCRGHGPAPRPAETCPNSRVKPTGHHSPSSSRGARASAIGVTHQGPATPGACGSASASV